MDNTQKAVSIFNKVAEVYQDKFMDVSLYHDTLNIFCNSIIRERAAVLDVACGPGNITKYLLSKRPDLNIMGTDLAPNMIALAAANNPEAKFQLMDCRQIIKLNKLYDGIICGFCLPYLSKEEAVQLIADAAKLMNKGGVLYISTMEDDYNKSGPKKGSSGDELYMYYHEAGYLEDTLAENDLKVTHLKRQDYPTTDGTKVTDLIIIAVKTPTY